MWNSYIIVSQKLGRIVVESEVVLYYFFMFLCAFIWLLFFVPRFCTYVRVKYVTWRIYHLMIHMLNLLKAWTTHFCKIAVSRSILQKICTHSYVLIGDFLVYLIIVITSRYWEWNFFSATIVNCTRFFLLSPFLFPFLSNNYIEDQEFQTIISVS